ncbi:hypothetical protein B0H12DRAFT_1245358 [Mycena haematopus]|nr:hypothetical protein B0H12DRAFT_1245358 [Mycena haematopus]
MALRIEQNGTVEGKAWDKRSEEKRRNDPNVAIDGITAGNVLDSAAVWCDLSTHFLNGFNLAIPACSLCYNRRPHQIASVLTVTQTKA